MQEQNQLDQWQAEAAEPQSATTMAEMDRLIAEYKAVREDYEAKKKISNEAHARLEDVEAKVIASLKANHRSKYPVDGLGTAYIINKETYTTPKNNDDKSKLFAYIDGKYGRDVLTSLLSINSQTLNSWANKESESGVMQIPGLEAPTLKESLGFRKER